MNSIESDPRFVEATLDDVAIRASELGRGDRFLLGVVGPPGAGKSTICDELSSRLTGEAVVLPMDGFHLDNPVLEMLGRRDRKGAPDTFDVVGFANMLGQLRQQKEVVYGPRFDRALELAIASAIPIPPEMPLIIVEGNYLLEVSTRWQGVRALLDEVWYLEVPWVERRRRLIARRMADGESIEAASAWVDGVDRPNSEVVERCRPRADLIIRVKEN